MPLSFAPRCVGGVASRAVAVNLDDGSKGRETAARCRMRDALRGACLADVLDRPTPVANRQKTRCSRRTRRACDPGSHGCATLDEAGTVKTRAGTTDGCGRQAISSGAAGFERIMGRHRRVGALQEGEKRLLAMARHVEGTTHAPDPRYVMI
jgi:hypothetical protein